MDPNCVCWLAIQLSYPLHNWFLLMHEQWIGFETSEIVRYENLIDIKLKRLSFITTMQIVVGSTNDYSCYTLFTIGNMITLYKYPITKTEI